MSSSRTRASALPERVQLGLGLGDQLLGLAVGGQGQVEQPPPQLVRAALGQRPGELRDPGQPGRGPRPGPARGRQPLADEDGADAVLGGHPLGDQGLAVGDQRPPLADRLGRDDDRRELAEGLQLGQPQGVVPVGLPLGVLELPRLGGGVGHLARDARARRTGRGPSRRGCTPRSRPPPGGRRGSAARPRPGRWSRVRNVGGGGGPVVDAGDALVLAQVDGENGAGGGRGHGGRRHGASSVGRGRTWACGNSTLPPPRLAWILSAALVGPIRNEVKEGRDESSANDRGGAPLLAVLAMIAVSVCVAHGATPTGWVKGGSDPTGCKSGTDTAEKNGGKASGFLQAKNPAAKEFGTMSQVFRADDFRGKSVRMTAWVKTKDVERSAALWMRVDSAEKSGSPSTTWTRGRSKGRRTGSNTRSCWTCRTTQ